MLNNENVTREREAPKTHPEEHMFEMIIFLITRERVDGKKI